MHRIKYFFLSITDYCDVQPNFRKTALDTDPHSFRGWNLSIRQLTTWPLTLHLISSTSVNAILFSMPRQEFLKCVLVATKFTQQQFFFPWKAAKGSQNRRLKNHADSHKVVVSFLI